MKIRQGFVSNSSSSSFIALGQEINISKITKEMIKDKEFSYIVFGQELYEGVDTMLIDSEEKLSFFKLFQTYTYSNNYKDNCEEDFTFYKILNKSSFRKEDLNDGESYSLIDETVDQNSSYSLKEMMYRYLDNTDPFKIKNLTEEECKEYLNRLFREKKLERITK